MAVVGEAALETTAEMTGALAQTAPDVTGRVRLAHPGVGKCLRPVHRLALALGGVPDQSRVLVGDVVVQADVDPADGVDHLRHAGHADLHVVVHRQAESFSTVWTSSLGPPKE